MLGIGYLSCLSLIYGLFIIAVIHTNFIMSKDLKITKQLTGKDREGSSHSLFEGTSILEFFFWG
jgi:hypothetical protein